MLIISVVSTVTYRKNDFPKKTQSIRCQNSTYSYHYTLWWIRRGIFWKNERLDDHVVLNLTAPFLGKGRNITCDNFFTSTNLAKLLSSKKTTIVGTVNRIGSEIPKVIKKRSNLCTLLHFRKVTTCCWQFTLDNRPRAYWYWALSIKLECFRWKKEVTRANWIL